MLANGTSYPDSVPADAVAVLERCRASGTRVVLTYSDGTKDTGRVGRTCGNPAYPNGGTKAAILVHNARSMGGSCFVGAGLTRIETSRGKVVLWSATVSA